MKTIEIHFDGGCKPTNPGNKYGSYDVIMDGEVVIQKRRLDLGWGTNNEAEFQILLHSLELKDEVGEVDSVITDPPYGIGYVHGTWAGNLAGPSTFQNIEILADDTPSMTTVLNPALRVRRERGGKSYESKPRCKI